MAVVHLKKGHVQPVWAGHPWVYAQAISRIDGEVTAGDEVSVVDPEGRPMGSGFITPKSAIPVRILGESPFDEAFFTRKVGDALALRRATVSGTESQQTTGYRVCFAEGDGVPGLIVDRFNDVLCIQLLTAGMYRRREIVTAAIMKAFADAGVVIVAIVDRTPESAASLEGFTRGEPMLHGKAPSVLAFEERGFRYAIPLELAQKTGFYFDQRDLRARVEALAGGRRVLDAYSYVGSFAMAAARGGAKEVWAVDSSQAAIAVAIETANANGVASSIRFSAMDAREAFVLAGQEGGYDLVVADPPRLAPSRAHRDHAIQAYVKAAALAVAAVTDGGILVFCSCSASVDLATLTRALATGARKANRSISVVERHFQGPDHPVPAAFPEGLYLKALVCQVRAR